MIAATTTMAATAAMASTLAAAEHVTYRRWC
jgi:hypothetical protein